MHIYYIWAIGPHPDTTIYDPWGHEFQNFDRSTFAHIDYALFDMYNICPE